MQKLSYKDTNDLFYKEEQDNYLEMLSSILSQGEPIPSDILADYKDYYQDANVPISSGIKGFFQSIFKFLNVKWFYHCPNLNTY